MKSWVSLCLLPLAACQLPQRQDLTTIDAIPNLTGTIIDSSNGLLSEGINKVPGSICIPKDDGKCDAQKLVPSQCLAEGAVVEVKPNTNPSPAYHSLVDDKYKVSGNVPFVSPSASMEYLDEIKAVISGTAQIKALTYNDGYPGVEGIRACLLEAYGPGNYDKVYWIAAANVIDVTRSNFRKVGSALSVTASAFGAESSTYNHNGADAESVWIGIDPRPIPVGNVSPPPAPTPADRHVTTRLSTEPSDKGFTIFVKPVEAPEPLPPKIEGSIL